MSAPPRESRPFDVVLLGATGFTGGLTAQRLASHGPSGMRWAIAGRDRGKLERVAAGLTGLGSAGAKVETVLADVRSADAMRSLAEQTRVLVTTVGPYADYGEPVVAACAQAGTDYADITGEASFVDQMWLRYHTVAVDSGARIVHACGFDSIPHDVGAWFTVNQLPEGVPMTVAGYVRAGAELSGGTYHTAVRSFSDHRSAGSWSARRRKLEPRPAGRRVRSLPQRPALSPDGRGYALPLPTIDPVIVKRSARALDRYGPDFAYGHYALVRSLPVAVGAPIVLGAMFGVAQIPWGRDALLRLRSQGDGPTDERRAKSWFTVRFYGHGGGRRVVTEVSGGDPGYTETSMMLAQSALCLAYDDLPQVAGQVTTVQAMGDALLDRVRRQGLTVRVVEDGLDA